MGLINTMSHRKFEAPRNGSLGFIPKRRTKHHRGRVRHFPRDDASKPVHLTAFMGFKAGMTHCVKYFERRDGKKVLKKDIVHAASVIECPPMKVIGMVGYIETPRGLRTLQTVMAQQMDQQVMRRFYKNSVHRDIARIKKYASTVRVLCATQNHLLKLRMHKAHVMEIQVNGGDIAKKVDWAYGKFEQEVAVGEVFE